MNQNILQTFSWRNIAAVATIAAFALAMLFSFAAPALAHSDPAECSSTGVVVLLDVFENDGVTPATNAQSGQTLKYVATLSHVGGSQCNYEGGTLTITTPDGVVHDVTPGGGIPLVSLGNNFVSDPVSYVAAEANAVGDNDFDTRTDYVDGISHRGVGEENTGGFSTISTPYEDVALEVSKTAVPAAEETYSWTIDKSVTPAAWDLFDGDSGTSEYTIDLVKSLVGTTYSVSGEITITNPAEFAVAHVTDVTDLVSGLGNAIVSCPEGLSFDMDPEEIVVCTYEMDLDGDNTARTNTASVETDGDVDGADSAPVDFDPSQAEPTVVNGSVDVNDTFDAGDETGITESGSYTYERQFVCGGDNGFEGTGNVVDNTATIVGTDESDDASVTVNCYDLSVEKTALTTYDRTWTWNIDKSADQETLDPLAEGQLFGVNYTVEVDALSSDDNHMVSGQITITNNHPTLDAEIDDVTDEIDDSIAATVICPSDIVPANGGTLICTYGPVAIDGDAALNEVSVDQQNYNYHFENAPVQAATTQYLASAPITFGEPTTETDECVDVSDDNVGALGTVCASDVDKTFGYTVWFGTDGSTLDPEDLFVEIACGEGIHPNIASFLTNDLGLTGEDNWTVNWTVNCFEGCSLTQGYWKTHNDEFHGGAPTDATWMEIGDWDGDETEEGELEGFYPGVADEDNLTWFEIFWTPPKGGNVWYQLAHQWMAAKLNTLAEADPAEITPELDDAQTWLLEHHPSEKLKGKDATEAKEWASLFAAYNEGEIGPGHCDEDDTSDEE